MGNARWDPTDWKTYSAKHVQGKTQAQVHNISGGLKEAYDPKLITMRESCDSDNNPNATPIILASDVTGSMGHIAHKLMKDGINTVITEIYDRKPVTDPHIMVMAIGDARCDNAPLQATQFEADICLADQVRDLWIEGYGGGNGGESYSGAHLFAAMKCNIDAAKKRNQKGFLFTIGDEPCHDGMTRDQASRFLGINLEADVMAQEAVALAQRYWEVFHIVLVNEGYCSHDRRQEVLDNWHEILPERTISLENLDALAETIVSIIQVHQGADVKTVASSWSGDKSLAVADALGSVPATQKDQAGDLQRLPA